jgi:hypothetical protein
MYFEIRSIEDTGSEPVNLTDAQIYFRNEDSGGAEDQTITNLVKGARQELERAMNISLVAKTITIGAKEWKGFLPYGPVSGALTYTTGTGEQEGTVYPYLKVEDEAAFSYNTEPACREDINSAILELALFWYIRGEFTSREMPPKVSQVIKLHTRKLFIS